MTAAIEAAATNGVIGMLVPSLVGLWVMTQLRIWRTHPSRFQVSQQSRAVKFTKRRTRISGQAMAFF